ncbi:MAG TPA: hypothetical protein VFQ68_20205 [Streptosporangiaceae bacterium]|nr:hypothetical protein [Streptosporangiaceae bacterium]
MTGCNPLLRVAASAIACASVLRPCPAVKTRVRADSFGGTSTTRSPAAASLDARCLPTPQLPPAAQVRSGQRRTAASIAATPAASVPYRPPPTAASLAVMISIVADRLCGSIPMMT